MNDDQILERGGTEDDIKAHAAEEGGASYPTPTERGRGCPFCLMVNKFTTGRVFDIEPLNPVVPGHRLIIPAEHVSNFSDDPDLTAEVMRYAAEYAKRHGIDCNLITSKGSPATQTVFHLHVHIIPRNYNDGVALPWDTALTKRTVWEAALGAVKETLKKSYVRLPSQITQSILDAAKLDGIIL